MEDETLVRKLLNAVPDRYLQIVASIEQYSDLDEMTLEEAIGENILRTWTWKAKISQREEHHENFKERGKMEKPLIGSEEQEVSLQEENKGYKEDKYGSSIAPFPKKAKARSTSPLDLVYGDLCGPITPPTPSGKKYIFFRDVKFKENETWDWKDYISEHTDDEPEWTNFRIGNLEVTNNHDHETQPLEEDNEFPNNNDDDYASPRNSPLHPQTPHAPSTHSSEVNSQVTPNTSTQSYYQSDNESIQIIDSPSHFDHTPVRGFRTLKDLYEDTEELLLAEDEPKRLLSKLTHTQEEKITIE
ncbi:hypothetical protein Tco_0312068 [Tanacetum coccineum]